MTRPVCRSARWSTTCSMRLSRMTMSTLARSDAVLAVEHAAGVHDGAALRDVRLPREIDRHVGDAVVGDVDQLQAARRFDTAGASSPRPTTASRPASSEMRRGAPVTSPVGVVGMTCMHAVHHERHLRAVARPHRPIVARACRSNDARRDSAVDRRSAGRRHHAATGWCLRGNGVEYGCSVVTAIKPSGAQVGRPVSKSCACTGALRPVIASAPSRSM